MEKIILGLLMATAMIANVAVADTVFTGTTNNGSVINLTDDKPCYINGQLMPNQLIAIGMNGSTGKSSQGCWTKNVSDDPHVYITWFDQSVSSFDIGDFNITPYGTAKYGSGQ